MVFVVRRDLHDDGAAQAPRQKDLARRDQPHLRQSKSAHRSERVPSPVLFIDFIFVSYLTTTIGDIDSMAIRWQRIFTPFETRPDWPPPASFRPIADRVLFSME